MGDNLMSRKGEPMNIGLQRYALATVHRLQMFLDSDLFFTFLDKRLHFDENIRNTERNFIDNI